MRKDPCMRIYQKLKLIITILGLEDVAFVPQKETFTQVCTGTNTSTGLNHNFSDNFEEHDVNSCRSQKTKISDHRRVENNLSCLWDLDMVQGVGRLNNGTLKKNCNLTQEQVSQLARDRYFISE